MIYVAITAAIIAVLYIILLIMYSKVFVNKDKYADYMTMPPQKKQYVRYAEAVKSEYFEAAAKKCYEPQKLDRKITKLLASEFGTVPDSFRLE